MFDMFSDDQHGGNVDVSPESHHKLDPSILDYLVSYKISFIWYKSYRCG